MTKPVSWFSYGYAVCSGGKNIPEVCQDFETYLGTIAWGDKQLVPGLTSRGVQPFQTLSNKVGRFKNESGIVLSIGKEAVKASSEMAIVTDDSKTTNEKLKRLSRNVQFYLTFLYLRTNVLPFGSNEHVNHSELMKLAAKVEKMVSEAERAAKEGKKVEEVKPIDVYIQHFREIDKLNPYNPYNPLTYLSELGTKFRYFYSHRLINAKVRIAFERILKEIRTSTDGKIQKVFEGILGHVNTFLTDYNKGGSLSNRIDGHKFSTLCKKITPLLIKEFYPEEDLSAKTDKIPFLGVFLDIPAQMFSYLLNQIGQALLLYYLPGVLEALSASVVNPTVEASGESKNLVNFEFAIPITNCINVQLEKFFNSLDASNLLIEQPLAPGTEEELTGVVTQVMSLARISGANPLIAKGIRSGLVRGGDALKQHLKNQPEVMLSELISLANIPFEENPLSSSDADRLSKYNRLKKTQNDLVERICDKIFEQQVQKIVRGTAEETINRHLNDSRKELISILDKGLSKDSVFLQSSLEKAEKNLEFQQYLQNLYQYVMRLDALKEKLQEVTASHNPAIASSVLLDEFSSVCQRGSEQMDVVERLYETWISYNRLLEAEKNIDNLRKELLNLDLVKSQEHFQRIVEGMNTIPISDDSSAKRLKGLQAQLKEIEEIRGLQKKSVEFEKFFEGFSPQPHKIRDIDDILGKNLIKDPLIIKKVQDLKSHLNQLDKDVVENIRLEIIKDVTQMVLAQDSQLSKKQSALLESMGAKQSPEVLGAKPLLDKCCVWMRSIIAKSKNESIQKLQEGRESLEALEGSIKMHLQEIKPSSLSFPMKGWVEDKIVSLAKFGGSDLKAELKASFSKILDKVGGLLTNKTLSDEENLYSWIERVTFYEVIKHLKNKHN